MSETGDVITRIEAMPKEVQLRVTEALDEAVHENKAAEASDINNAGLEAQVLFLGASTVEALLEDFESAAEGPQEGE